MKAQHTYKVWLHIEEIDEDGDPTEDEPTMPEQLGEYDALDEAQAVIDAVMSDTDAGPRPSAPEESEGHAPALLASLEKLSYWMRCHTGPADGTVEMLIEAVNAIAKAKGEPQP